MIDWSKLKTSVSTLEENREKVWDAIKQKRENVKYSGVNVSGKWFHSDAESRIQWMGMKDTGRDMKDEGATNDAVIKLKGKDVLWKTLAGDFVLVDIQLAFDVNRAVKELDAVAFATAEYHNALMRQAADPLTYNYNTGWPQTYEASIV